MLYVGFDVHRRRTQVAVVDEGGHELFNRNVVVGVDDRVSGLRSWLNRFPLAAGAGTSDGRGATMVPTGRAWLPMRPPWSPAPPVDVTAVVTPPLSRPARPRFGHAYG
jgi:hypothetical protein